IRPAREADLPAVSDIYNHYVLHSTCTFAEEPEGPAYWDAWYRNHTGVHPAIVALDGDEIVGWGTLSKWNNRCAYRFSVEDSVYVKDGLHRRGVGRTLMTRLVELAREHGHRSVVAQIADHQPASEKLHEMFGFREVGCLEKVGF